MKKPASEVKAMHDIKDNILSLDNFRIDFFRATVRTSKLMVTFTQFANRELNGLGFAGRFAVENGFDLVAIKSKKDDWYQTLPTDTFDLIEKFLSGLPERHSWRAAYGSSMGGYAAILFAHELRADVVLAFSPQFDIAQDWDRRWANAAKTVGSLKALGKHDVSPQCQYFIVYDPADPDRLHFERFASIIPSPQLHAIKIPHAGHPVGYFLFAVGALKTTALGVLGESVATGLALKIRAGREKYPNYFYNLAGHCLRKRRTRWARYSITKALSLEPLNSDFHFRAAHIAETAGDLPNALSEAELAVAISPKRPHMIAKLAGLLHKMGRHQEALHYMDEALALGGPHEKSLANMRAVIQRSLESDIVKDP